MPLAARRFVRKMRGGAQAHLMEADDGNFYVVKFKNNPQHRRILVNELIAGTFLRYLQLSTPEIAVIEVSSAFLEANPDVHIQLGSRRIAVEPGRHFASRFPGDPFTMAVYDFVPDAMLHTVVNRNHFLGMLVFDKWTGNADARQSIFFRARLKEWGPEGGTQKRRMGFVALMIDHGYAFDGPHWGFTDSAVQGLYFRTSVYEGVRSWDDFQPWLDQVANFPEEVVDEAWRQVPREWLNGDEEALEALLLKLLRRRVRVADLIRDCTRGKVNPFPNWT